MSKFSIIFIFSILFCACGVEDGSGKDSSFSYILTTTCKNTGNASQCIASSNGASIKVYAILETCNSLFGADPDPTEIGNAIADSVGVGSGVAVCGSSGCTDQVETWMNVTQQGSLTLFVLIDTDQDEVFGESGEVFACEDGMPFNSGGSDIIIEDSASLGYMDIL